MSLYQSCQRKNMVSMWSMWVQQCRQLFTEENCNLSINRFSIHQTNLFNNLIQARNCMYSSGFFQCLSRKCLTCMTSKRKQARYYLYLHLKVDLRKIMQHFTPSNAFSLTNYWLSNPTIIQSLLKDKHHSLQSVKIHRAITK